MSEIEQAVKEIEAYVAADGWDGPVRVFSLVDAETAMSVNSALAAELPADATGRTRYNICLAGSPGPTPSTARQSALNA